MLLRTSSSKTMHQSWDAAPPRALCPHDSHGRGHGAFAVAIGAGVVVDEARRNSRGVRNEILWRLARPLLARVATFLSRAAGFSLVLFPDLPISPLSAPPCLLPGLRAFLYSPPSPSPFSPFLAQSRKMNSRHSCGQRMRRVWLSCLAVSPNCLASRKSTFRVAA